MRVAELWVAGSLSARAHRAYGARLGFVHDRAAETGSQKLRLSKRHHGSRNGRREPGMRGLPEIDRSRF